MEGDVFDRGRLFLYLGISTRDRFLSRWRTFPLGYFGPRFVDTLWGLANLPARRSRKPAWGRLDRNVRAPADVVERETLCPGAVGICSH